MRRPIIGLLLCILVSVNAAVCADTETEKAAERLYKAALALQNNGGPPLKCLQLYQQIIAQYPDTKMAKWAKMRAASRLWRLEQYDAAIAACQSVVDEYPGDLVSAWAQYYKAASLLKMENYSDAAREFYKVEEYTFNLDREPLYNERKYAGSMFSRLEDAHGFDSALETFGIDRRDRQKMAWVYTSRVFWAASVKRFELAESRFGELRQQYPEFTDIAAQAAEVIANYMLSKLEEEENPTDPSRLLYFLSLPRQLSPTNQLAVAKSDLHLAQYHLNISKDYDAAQQILESIVNNPIANEARYQLGQCLVKRGEHSQAAEVYATVVSGWAESAAYMRGQCLLESRDFTSAKQALLDAMSSEDICPTWRMAARKKLIGAYLSTGDKERAVELLREDLAVLQQAKSDKQREGNQAEVASLTQAIEKLTERIDSISPAQGGNQ